MRRSRYAEVLSVKRLAAVAVTALAACALASAQPQDTKLWTGILFDGSGNAIPGAVVRLRRRDAVVNAKTAQDGRFTFPALTAGEYSISVESQGTTAKT